MTNELCTLSTPKTQTQLLKMYLQPLLSKEGPNEKVLVQELCAKPLLQLANYLSTLVGTLYH